jgi:hypothetical protein
MRRGPRGGVEPAAEHELDDARRHEQDHVELADRDERRQPQRRGHHHGAGHDCCQGLQAQAACLPGASLGVDLGLFAERLRFVRGRGLADLVAGGLDRMGQLVAPDAARVEADAGLLSGQVDVRRQHAVGLAQEALDPIAARGAGHALDRQCELDRLHIEASNGSGARHTPPEYTRRLLRLLCWREIPAAATPNLHQTHDLSRIRLNVAPNSGSDPPKPRLESRKHHEFGLSRSKWRQIAPASCFRTWHPDESCV